MCFQLIINPELCVSFWFFKLNKKCMDWILTIFEKYRLGTKHWYSSHNKKQCGVYYFIPYNVQTFHTKLEILPCRGWLSRSPGRSWPGCRWCTVPPLWIKTHPLKLTHKIREKLCKLNITVNMYKIWWTLGYQQVRIDLI